MMLPAKSRLRKSVLQSKKRSRFLKAQNQNGSWAEFTGYPGGVTCLCTLALLNAGVPVEDEQMRRALDYIRTLPPDSTYVTSLQTMVLCMAEPKKDLLLIRRNARWLEELQNKDGDRKGAWPYRSDMRGGGDPSNSQFALLALYEAERAGIPVRDRTWNLGLQYWLRQQNPDGSWAYEPAVGAPGRGSMTCAGIASLYITSGRLNSGDAEITADGLQCCGQHTDNPSVKAMENGLTWLGNNFSVQVNPGPGGLSIWNMYYLYAVERVGRMTSHRFFTSRDFRRYDWYRMGAEWLIAKQDALSGYWKGEGRRRRRSARGHELRDFVSSQRAPPRVDFKSALRQRRQLGSTSRRFGRSHVVRRNKMEVAIFLSAFPGKLSTWPTPRSTICCKRPCCTSVAVKIPSCSTKRLKLREYIDRGGFIFAEACCPDSSGFDAGFRQLMEKTFDEPEYRLRPVPPEHPLWNAEEPVRPALRPNLWMIDYGCRTSVVYAAPPEPNKGDLPNSLSCYWEIASGRDRKLPPNLQEQLGAALSMGINVLAYATNRELKSKDENFQIADDTPKEPDTFERGSATSPTCSIPAAAIPHPERCPVCSAPPIAN